MSHHPWGFALATLSFIVNCVLLVAWLSDPQRYPRAEPALALLAFLTLLFGFPSMQEFFAVESEELDTAKNGPSIIYGDLVETNTAYKKDEFFGLLWHWSYSIWDQQLKITKICCPKCELEVDLFYLENDKIAYVCEDHKTIATLDEEPYETKRRVLKRVDRNYETGAWKEIVKRQTSDTASTTKVTRDVVDEDQKKWLEALAIRARRSERVNTRELLVELSNQLPKDFDATRIDPRLSAGGNCITVLGRALINPFDKHVQETNVIAIAIRDMLISDPNVTQITARQLSDKTGLEYNDVTYILESLSGGLGGGYFHGSGTSNGPSGWASIYIDNEVFKRYINFESVEAILENMLGE